MMLFPLKASTRDPGHGTAEGAARAKFWRLGAALLVGPALTLVGGGAAHAESIGAIHIRNVQTGMCVQPASLDELAPSM